MTHRDLPLPPHFNPNKVGEVWKVPYQERAEAAEKWAQQQHIPNPRLKRIELAQYRESGN